VPSPNVSEDHQTKNALALTEKDAAVLIKDSEAATTLVNKVVEILYNKNSLKALGEKIGSLARPNALKEIVNTIETAL
jgi:UDP-N-acetylglucosamine--N-acetylmuramyl-(pentapeptide) pyrophosphoryl-undecaprenol N-acetylglucosamine transferase